MIRPAAVVLLAAFAGCASPEERAEKQAAKEKKKAHEERVKSSIPDPSNDVSYQSFVTRLRQAATQKDMATLASLMTPDFGYSLDPLLEGDGVFKYWEENGLWTELQMVLNERFIPLGAFVVSPPQFAEDPNYTGYRAGITRVSGSWRFAYFVKG